MTNLLIEERPLMVLPGLVKRLGSMERAVVLQQMHWLLSQPQNGKADEDGNKWVWGTLQEWCDDYFRMWQPDALRRHLNWLRANDYILVSKLANDKWNKTNYYRINYEKLSESGINRSASMSDDRHASKGDDRHASLKEAKTSTENSKPPKPPVTKTPKSTPKPAWELPDWINPQAWAEFEMHRRDLRKPLTDLGRTKAANTLNGLSHDQQQQCIDASIQAGWAGLFPKGAKGQDQQQTTGGLKTGVQPDGSYYDPEFGLCV